MGLLSADLIPRDGGTWSGLLFDNPRIGIPPRLTWTFEFPYHDAVDIAGDLDRLGVESITAEAWLHFDGIRVALSDMDSPELALHRLRDFTDPTGLSPTPVQQHNSYRFIPAET